MPPQAKRKRHLSSQFTPRSQGSQQIPPHRPLAGNEVPPPAESSQISNLGRDTGRVNSGMGHGFESDEEDENLDLIVMAVDVKDRGTVGCAYYVAREERLFCLDEVQRGGDMLVQTLIADLNPTVVTMSPRVDPAPGAEVSIRRPRLGSLVEDDEDLRLPYQLHIRPASEFSVEAAKNKLVNLDSIFEGNNNFETRFITPGDAGLFEGALENHEVGLTTRHGRYIQLSAWIDLDNTISVGCVGAILAFLQRRRSRQYLQDDPAAQEAYKVRTIEMFSLSGTMFVSAETLLSLQIMQPEFHPNAYNQGPSTKGSKESLSVYGLFHQFARSPQGKALLRQHFLRPLQDITCINERLDSITILIQPENALPMQKFSKSFSKIKNLRPIMIHLHKGINIGNNKFGGFKSGVWATLLDFAFHAIDVRETFGEMSGAERLPIMSEVYEALDANQLRRIGSMINEVVDIDISMEQHRTVIKHGIDDSLDNMKRVYNGLDSLLCRAARDILTTIPPGLGVQVNVVYFPQLGFHIALPADQSDPVTGMRLLGRGADDWQIMFTAEDQVFLKDSRMREMDQTIGDVYSNICEKEIEISYELAQRVLLHEKILIAASEVCGKVDSLAALAHGATRYGFTRPLLTEENIIKIIGGRHPLQELAVASYVPNDAFLVGGQSRHRTVQRRGSPDITAALNEERPAEEPNVGPNLLVMTGPNYSGKSVYLKQVALAVYMTHVGSFVPAQSAVIGLTDKILTRITTRETVSKAQSAFMIDLQQIAIALNMATRRSLIIIDEFGKGTDSSDGAGLAAGVFHHILSLKNESPKVIAATHFHEIFEQGFLKPQARLAQAHMEVRLDPSMTPSSIHEVTYLYNLRPGLSTQSYGTSCASLNGIPAPITQRANLLAKLSAKGHDLVAACAGISRDEKEDLEVAEKVARRFVGVILEAWDGAETRLVQSVDGDEEKEEGGEEDVVRRLLSKLILEAEGGLSRSPLGST